MKIKPCDFKLFNILLGDSRICLNYIAPKLNLGVPALYSRFTKLVKFGYIKRFVSLVDFKFIKYNIPVIFIIKSDEPFLDPRVNTIIHFYKDIYFLEVFFSNNLSFKKFKDELNNEVEIKEILFIKEKIKNFGFKF